jgi:ApbE superfamily uncharacterized protein (UPF0280 family)
VSPDDSSRNVTADGADPADAPLLARMATSDAGNEVEAALARALGQAADAGRFDVVALLAGELQARRLARGGVTALDEKRRRRAT